MKKIFLITSLLAFGAGIFIACDKDLTEDTLYVTQLKSTNKGNDKLTGFDQWGYNWNAHQFNGYLINAWFGDEMDPEADWYKHEPYNGDWKGYPVEHPEVFKFDFWYYGNMTLVMHWNESMISREGIYPDEIKDTDAWITFHYRSGEGKNKWSQFQKFVAVKSTDKLLVYYYDPITGEPVWGEWFSKDGESVGQYYLWPDIALVQVVNTGDVPEGMHLAYKSPSGTGLGKYKSR